MRVRFDGTPVCASKITGIGTYQKELCQRLVKKHKDDEFEYTFFTLNNASRKKEIMSAYKGENAKIKSFPLLNAGLYKLISGIIPLPYRMLFPGKAQITHFFNFLIPPGVKGKKVVTVHDFAFIRYPETVTKRTRLLLNSQLKKTVKRSDRLVVVSEFTAKEFTELYGVQREKMTVVYCGVDTEKFKQIPSEEKNEILKGKGLEDKGYFLYLGTIEPRKNINALVGAYAQCVRRMRSEGREAPLLVLAGKLGWYFDEILQRIKDEGIEDRIILPGYITEQEKIALYCGARAFVFPSLYEGFGIPVLEAMSCGAPVLTADAASLPEVAGDAAVLCDPHSEESISEGMYTLATDDEMCAELAEKGRARAKEFSWEKEADKLYELYRELVNE